MWLNVKNHGKTAVRRMRLKAKIALSPTLDEFMEARKADKKANIKELYEAILKKDPVRASMIEAFEGRWHEARHLVPRQETPMGSLFFSWELDNGESISEIDLAPKDDDASAKLLTVIHVPHEVGDKLEKRIVDEGKDFNLWCIGNDVANLLPNFGLPGGEPMFTILVRVWLVGENLDDFDPRLITVEIDKTTHRVALEAYDWWTDEYRIMNEVFAAGSKPTAEELFLKNG